MSKKIQTNKKEFVVTTLGKKLMVSDGEVNLQIRITNEHIELMPKGGDEFVFKSKNSTTTLKRWRKVVDCLSMAVTVLEKERKI